jgi:hypothetical protein
MSNSMFPPGRRRLWRLQTFDTSRRTAVDDCKEERF